MTSRATIILDSVVHLLRPVVRLMLRHGVGYPAFCAALKKVFLQAATEELQSRSMALTDSALSLMSGVHRRDVRNLGRLAPPDAAPPPGFAGLASQVVARWLSQDDYLDVDGTPRSIERAGAEPSFDALVAAVSRDVRPRSVLDELVRLGLAAEADGRVRLLVAGFVPRQGFEELSRQFRDNLHDHLAAAAMNLDDRGDFLEQSVFVDQITAESALRLHKVSAQAWKHAFRLVMREAQARFDEDGATAEPAQRDHRARFGVYFFSTADRHEPALHR